MPKEFINFQPLLSLIPEIKSCAKFGKLILEKKNENGSFAMPYYDEEPIVHKFRLAVQQSQIMIPFDWRNWEKGYEIIANPNFDYHTIDIDMICKMITMIIRNDRFCEGYLIKTMENGQMLKLLLALKKINK